MSKLFSTDQDVKLLHNDALALVHGLRETSLGKIKNHRWLAGQDISLELVGGSYQVHFKYHISKQSIKTMHTGNDINRLKIAFKDQTIVLHDVYLREYSPPHFKGFVPRFQTEGFPERRPCFHRMIIPLSRELNLYHILETATFSSDVLGWSRASVLATVADHRLIASVVKQNNQKYLFIDGLSKSPFEAFEDRAHSLKNAIGYLTGHLPGNEAYFIASSVRNETKIKHFRYHAIRPELRVGYTPLNANSFAWTRQKSQAERIYKKQLLRVVSASELSRLSTQLYGDNELTSVVLAILESLSASLITMPRSLAIALEMLADIIVVDKEPRKNPIENPTLARTIRDECMAVVKKHTLDLSEDAMKILTIKINGLNQVPNQSRLKAPFVNLDINLSKAESDTIGTRNDFLHGRIPDITKSGPNRSMARLNGDCMYAAMRFYTLLNMAILKNAGFDNYVLNHAKLQEAACLMKINESNYRKL